MVVVVVVSAGGGVVVVGSVDVVVVGTGSAVVVVVGSVRQVVSPRAGGGAVRVGDGVYPEPPAPPYGCVGSAPASVPGGVAGADARFGSRVKADVVSALVPVIGGMVSPGPWMVDVTPLAAPSCTVSYCCCWPRAASSFPPHAIVTKSPVTARNPRVFLMFACPFQSQAPCQKARLLRQSLQEESMAKDSTNQGGPTRERKDEPTADRSHINASSRAEIQERSVKGDRPGQGRRNGSAKKK